MVQTKVILRVIAVNRNKQLSRNKLSRNEQEMKVSGLEIHIAKKRKAEGKSYKAIKTKINV